MKLHTPLLSILFLLILTACQLPEQTPVETPAAEESPAIQAYFTDPRSTDARLRRNGLDVLLVEAIDSARLSVDAAIYDLNLFTIRNALIDAHQRGVTVRVVAESDQLDRQELQDLKDAGIPVLGDRRESLMHNKFIILDRQEVWTGSLNYTFNGVFDNDNNLLQVRSTKIAENYLAEFEEMFTDDQFGAGSPANTPNPNLDLNGMRIETYFSPDDGVERRIVELISGATQSIDMLAFSFTSDPIAAAILAKAQAGLAIRIVLDFDQAYSNTGGEYQNLLDAGLDVRLDGNWEDMHHKVIVIDGETVITGSYNFSRSAAERNDENVLVITDAALAGAYLGEFERVYSLAKP